MPVHDVTFKYPSPIPNLFGKRVIVDTYMEFVEAGSPDEIIDLFEDLAKKLKVEGLLRLTYIRTMKRKNDYEELLTLDGLKSLILGIVGKG